MALAPQAMRDTLPQTAGACRTADTERQHKWQRIIVALLFVAAIKQVVLALAYPPFQGHDEIGHYGYVRTIAEAGRLPTLSDNLPEFLATYSRYGLDWPAMYESLQPPLYYLMLWPVYELAGPEHLSQLYAMRLATIPLFLATVWISYRLAVIVFPDDSFLAVTVPAAIAFQPQVSFAGAIINNDPLTNFLGALLLYLSITVLRDGLTVHRGLMLGVFSGLGLLAKATLLALLPFVAGIAIWCCRPRSLGELRAGHWWRFRVLLALAIGFPIVLIASPWYLFLERIYGDFTGLQALDLLEAVWNVPDGSYGELLVSIPFHLERLHEAWGYYGWKLLPLTSIELRIIYAASLLVSAGAALGVIRFLRTWRHRRLLWLDSVRQFQATSILALLLASGLMYGAIIYYGVAGGITQARYMFPVAPAVAVLAMLSLRELIPQRWRPEGAALVITAAAAFEFALLSRAVLPYSVL